VPGIAGSDTSLGDLTTVFKGTLWENPATGSIITGGLVVTAPTGSTADFGNDVVLIDARSWYLQPWLGTIQVLNNRLYLQAFSSLAVPTGSDVTLWFNDIGIGYAVYKASRPRSLVSAIIPLVETHVTTPMSYRDVFGSVNGTPDAVTLTGGTAFQILGRSYLTCGVATPVTGLKPFDVEAVVQFNWGF
jgi:hypothetical protein